MNIVVNGINFSVTVIYKRKNKRIYLRVKNGTVEITTPTKLSRFSIEDMIEKNYNSIVKIMRSNKKIEDQIHFLGDCYTLEIQLSSKNIIYIQDQKMMIECINKAFIPNLIASFYNNALSKIVEIYAQKIINEFGIQDEIDFSYKDVSGYYGECFPTKKKIILSSKLAKYELKYILSVIYHECAHFKFTNHQKEFYEYLESIYPNYRSVQHQLRKTKYQDAY